MDFKDKKDKQKGSIDDTVGFTDRLKYMALPLVLTVGSYFGPEIKKRYDSLPEAQKVKCRKIGYASAGIAGLVMTMMGGYNYYKENKNKDEETAGFTYVDKDG